MTAVNNPKDKVRVLQRALYTAAKGNPQRRFLAPYDRISRPGVLRRGWEQVRRNRGAAGIDGETIEASFRPNSYGFRPKRSAHQALEAIRKEVNAGGNWVVDGDVAGFFGSLDHDLLLRLVSRRGSVTGGCCDCCAYGCGQGCWKTR